MSAIPSYERGEQYTHLLGPLQLDRGMGYLGSLSRLQKVMMKLKEGLPVRVVTIGGSVTAGLHGVGDGLPWPQYLFDFLQNAYPDNQSFLGTNAAVPGTISSYMAACVNIHVPNTTNLILVEYSVNDVHQKEFQNEYRRAYERLIRKLLSFPNKPAVILMHSYNWMAPTIGTFYNSIERELYEFSLFYDVPSISLKAAVYHELRKGSEAKDGFSVERARMEDVEGLAGRSFYFDKIHPDALTGARMMGELAFHLMEKAAEKGAGGGSEGSDSDSFSDSFIPDPLFEGNFESPLERCFVGSKFQNDAVVSAEGFDWLNDSQGRAPKFGFISTKKGSVLKIKVSTVASSSASIGSSPEGDEEHEERPKKKPQDEEVQVQIIHLRSYEGMGSATIRCESGCSCEDDRLVGSHKSKNSQLFLHSLYVTQHPDCILSITQDPGPRASSRLKVKVTGIIVSEEPGEQRGSAKSVEVVEMVSQTMAKSANGTFDLSNRKPNQ